MKCYIRIVIKNVNVTNPSNYKRIYEHKRDLKRAGKNKGLL